MGLRLPYLAALLPVIAWPDSLTHISEGAKWLIAVGGAVAVLVGATKRGRTLALRWWERRAAYVAMPGNVAKLVVQVEDVSRRIEKIEKESMPNGGNSINDRVKAIYNLVQVGNARSLAFQDRAPTAIYECGPTGETLVVNRAVCEIFGMSHEDMVADNGRGWLLAINTQAERARVEAEWKTSIRDSIPYRANYTLRNGTVIDTVADPIKSETGELLGFRGTIWATGKNGQPIGPPAPPDMVAH